MLPGLLDAADLAPALGELGRLHPTLDGFRSGTDPRRQRYLDDEFAGIDTFPFESVALSLLTVHPTLVALARELLGGEDLRITSAESWAKYSGAADYDQPLHRDYLNHTLLVPTDDPEFAQLELFVYLTGVDGSRGGTRFVSRRHTVDMPAVPNWLVRPGETLGGGRFETDARAHVYDAEQVVVGPAGTVAAFTTGTFHRGAAIVDDDIARHTLHVCFRPATVEWGQRVGWADRSHSDAWRAFVEHASAEQRALFGFPPPGHGFWTERTLADLHLRYPGLDITPYRDALAP